MTTVDPSKVLTRARFDLFLQLIGREFGVTPEALRSRARPEPLSTARRVAMFLSREEFLEPNGEAVAFEKIGELLNRSNPWTANYAHRTIVRDVSVNAKLAARVERLRQQIRETL